MRDAVVIHTLNEIERSICFMLSISPSAYLSVFRSHIWGSKWSFLHQIHCKWWDSRPLKRICPSTSRCLESRISSSLFSSTQDHRYLLYESCYLPWKSQSQTIKPTSRFISKAWSEPKEATCHFDMICSSWTHKHISILHVYFTVIISILDTRTHFCFGLKCSPILNVVRNPMCPSFSIPHAVRPQWSST